MSTKGIRDFRPKIHFTLPSMWMNDPNGLVYVHGYYHLFYQFYPNDTVWGPMHWGHARSTDLLSWEHLPVALAPDDELGNIFSGSAIYDEKNRSGFAKDGKMPIVAMFTHHGACEQQSIAYSLDGVNFTKYENNPVIPNKDYKDFRDPKVFTCANSDTVHMALAAGDKILFYKSDNLKTLEKTGEFGPGSNVLAGVWECPDLFSLATPNGQKWVLLVSMSMSTEDGGSRTQYFIGDFDGRTFTCDDDFKTPLFLDEGFDHYAGVTWNNNDDGCILIGWGINWQYASMTPTNEYCGMMTLARRLSLCQTPCGIRLASTPIVKASGFKPITDGTTLKNEIFGVKIKGTGACKVSFSNENGQSLVLGVSEENEFYFDRSNAGSNCFSEIFASELYSKKSVKRLFEGGYEIDVIVDVSSVEIYLDEGTLSSSSVIFPDSAYTNINLHGDVTALIYEVN